MAAGATGRVLDLGDWTDHLDSYRTAAEVSEVVVVEDPSELPDGDAYDTILSFVRTPLVVALDDYVDALLAVLADDGRIGFLDTVRPPRRASGRLRLSRRRARPGAGLHLGRDLPHELRELGLVVSDLHRFTVPSVSAPFGPFVEAWVRRRVTP